MPHRSRYKAYWRKNLLYVIILLSFWAIVSFGFSIIFVDQLDTIRIGGFGLGFWFSQQGTIYIFVLIIFIYVFLMNRLDKSYDVDEQEVTK
jgi:putative solute:sodium symporter small subunit